MKQEEKDIILKYSARGCSVVEILKDLYLTKKQHVIRLADDEEYKECFDRAVILFESWWRRQGRVNLKNKEFNYMAWYKHMVHEFKWDIPGKEKKESDDPVDEKTEFNVNVQRFKVKKSNAVVQ